MSPSRLSILETAALILGLLFAAATARGADAGRSGTDLTPAQIAKWRIPGEREKDHCAEYTWCLRLVLFQKGVECREMVYDWQKGRRADSHSVLLFRLPGSAQWLLIENEKDKAVPVSGATDLELAQCFNPRAVSVWADPGATWGRKEGAAADLEAGARYTERLAKARAKGGF